MHASTPHAQAVRAATIRTREAKQSLADARERLRAANAAASEHIRAVRAAEQLVRDAETTEELTVIGGKRSMIASLSEGERWALHCWMRDLEDALQVAQLKPPSPALANRVTQILDAARSAIDLQYTEDPIAEIATIRERLKIKAFDWSRAPTEAEADRTDLALAVPR